MKAVECQSLAPAEPGNWINAQWRKEKHCAEVWFLLQCKTDVQCLSPTLACSCQLQERNHFQCVCKFKEGRELGKRQWQDHSSFTNNEWLIFFFKQRITFLRANGRHVKGKAWKTHARDSGGCTQPLSPLLRRQFELGCNTEIYGAKRWLRPVPYVGYCVAAILSTLMWE